MRVNLKSFQLGVIVGLAPILVLLGSTPVWSQPKFNLNPACIFRANLQDRGHQQTIAHGIP